jgi:hypothetical protein
MIFVKGPVLGLFWFYKTCLHCLTNLNGPDCFTLADYLLYLQYDILCK